MKLLRSTDVFEESWFLFLLMKLLGLLPLNFRKIKIFRYTNAILLLTLYYVTFALTIKSASHVLDALDETSTANFPRRARYFLNTVLFPIAMFSGARQGSKIKKVYCEINEIDRYLRYYSVLLDYEYCMRKDVVFIFGAVTVTLLFNLMDYYSLMDYSRDYKYVVMWILDRLPDFTNTIVICCLSIILDKIHFRFERVNEIVERMTRERQISTIEILSVSNNSFRVKLPQLLNQKLCKVSVLASEVSRFPLTFFLVLYFVCICVHVNTIYIKIDQPTEAVDVLMSVLWVTFDIGKFAYVLRLQHINASKYVPWNMP